ncbi:MAG: bifunctional (p)ppGpp synthetase/guanosine-3',5'-bis(diphosphate) 3'-pyrophosphohydrolase [Alphaproteobacteria bacterium]|nr:bifunctional (p)ppGpp synthetase/guanosine-3',5'-bis(diphosphate) 3'-pyrophosphohydrolase [Alphaproteobacteria bacterium]
MLRQFELVEQVTSYDPDADEALLNRAYVYAMKAHGSQKRASGDPYFSHPLAVAAILIDLKLDDATIAAALLHDTIEDTEATKQEIDELFGSEIAGLVDGLTKLKRLDLVTKEAAQAENLRKFLLAISDDIRVLLVKLADRLHNMRTLGHMRKDKRERIAQETMDIYAPLAGRIGMQAMRDELDDISFKVLNEEAHATITARLKALRQESGNLLREIEQALTQKLEEHHIPASVSGREKRPYSIWRKMERKQISLGQLSDIYGFRVVVENMDDCYTALGVVHQTWRVVPGRFKDYISNPKTNNYQSLHTTVVGPHRKRIELQIRTHEMHDIAEHGVAAHSLYRDLGTAETQDGDAGANGGTQENGEAPDNHALASDANAYRWLSHLVDMLSEGDGPKEFLEHTKLELFHDQVFCFTPNGDLIALPSGATPIDFAYAVHTNVGDTCVGCLINGRHAPLITELKNGDEVEIVRSEAQVPPAAWEKFVITGKARAAIRRATRLALRQQYAGLGREILDRALKVQTAAVEDEELQIAIERLGEKNLDDVLAKIGRGEIACADVLKALGIGVEDTAPKPGFGVSQKLKSLGQYISLPRGRPKRQDSGAIPVRGLKGNLPFTISLDTGAVPGERIVGIMTPDVGVTIYPIFSDGLRQYDDEPDRWIDLTWDLHEGSQETFPARIQVTVLNQPGALAQVAQTIADGQANINNLELNTQSADVYDFKIIVEVSDLQHLTRIMRELGRAALVTGVSRMTGAE